MNATLSLRERNEIDAVFARVRRGDHYEVLNLSPDADADTIEVEAARVQRWVDKLLEADGALGDYLPKVEAIGAAVQTAARVLGTVRERMRYDAGRQAPGRRDEGTPGSSGTQPRGVDEDTAPAELRFLLTVLQAQLSMAVGRPVDVLARWAELETSPDRGHASLEGASAEQEGRWVDAAVWWHLAGLAAPHDPAVLLRAASALRRAGAVDAYGAYVRVVDDPWFRPAR